MPDEVSTLHEGGGDMEPREVAGAWLAGVGILATCLVALTGLSGDGEVDRQGARQYREAPVREGLPRSWFEVTGSLPVKMSFDGDPDHDDETAEIEWPDPPDLLSAAD
jgi:hypothetical protein